MGVAVEVGAEAFGIVAGATGGQGAEVALVGELVLGADAAIAGDDAAGGARQLGTALVDHAVAVEHSN